VTEAAQPVPCGLGLVCATLPACRLRGGAAALMSMSAPQAASVSAVPVGTRTHDGVGKLTIPSPIDKTLCSSAGIVGREKSVFSLDATSVGLGGTSEAVSTIDVLRQTNLSNSCSSLLSRSPMWWAHGWSSSLLVWLWLLVMGQDVRLWDGVACVLRLLPVCNVLARPICRHATRRWLS
jgi:hypothetical protein